MKMKEIKELERKYINREAELLLIIRKTRKYKKMWKELYFHHATVFLHDENPEILLEKRMDEIKQKYFSEGK